MGRLKPLIEFILQFGLEKNQNSSVQLQNHHLFLLEDLEHSFNEQNGLKKTGITAKRALATLQKKRKVRLPASLCTELRDYQVEGLVWLQQLFILS